jgi:hypothetical protein
MTQFTDLYSLSEDDRIRYIGKAAETGMVVGFIVDSGAAMGRTKIDRYIKKLTSTFPLIEIIDESPGLVANTTLIRCRLKPS